MHAITAPDPIASLWQAARAFFERLRAAVGEAQTIARQRHLDPDALAQMRAWLRPLEAMVRKIVLLQAMRLARTPEPPRPQQAKRPPLVHYGPAPQAPYPQPRERNARFRLWPRRKPHPARIRRLGPPLLVRDIYRERFREAQADRLNMVRFMRAPEPQRIAGRIAALERVLAKPLVAARRLARKLRTAPRLVLRLAVARWPRSPYADADAQATADRCLWADALAFNSDTS
ncbi:MAG: hypothetical protein KJZ75_02895 [Hyphomonadaceae bacterium]|nr:hypothetical protein [Hyphomonadaceae bacterium]GIK50569.1 MAG: hypothetical protein BroJett013_32660 [Alphaproteobacteria bacterium]